MSRSRLLALLLLAVLALLTAGCGGGSGNAAPEDVPVATGPVEDPNADEMAKFYLDSAYVALQEHGASGKFPASPEAAAAVIDAGASDLDVVVGDATLLEGAPVERVVVDSSSNAERVLLYAASTSGKLFQLESSDIAAVGAPVETK